MKILLVEDDGGKRDDLYAQLADYFGSQPISICVQESLRSAWRALSIDQYDLMVLDMSLPSSDTQDESGPNEPESFAGREIMDQMRLRNISVPVIVVTQYKTFEKGTVSLEELVSEFSVRYAPFFKGYIYYNASSATWRRELLTHLGEIFG